MEDEDGVQEGECPFVVHGITGENYSTLSKDATCAFALQHLIKDQNILFVGHGTKPESMFNNSQLFPINDAMVVSIWTRWDWQFKHCWANVFYCPEKISTDVS